MELGEDVESAAKREVFEETGIEIADLKIIKVESSTSKANVLVFFTCSPIDQSQILPFSNAEVLEVKSSTNETLCFPSHQEVFNMVNEQNKGSK